MLKDSSIRSIYTYLTGSPCYTTNTNKHNNTQTRERENSNSKTLILKDSSIRSIWRTVALDPFGPTYLTASPCYTTNTNKHDNTTNKRERELTQSLTINSSTYIIFSSSACHVKIIVALAQGVLKLLDQL